MTRSAMNTDDIAFDDEGYLLHPDEWSWHLAQQIARNYGIEAIKEQHRVVIEYLRKHYLEHKTIPVMRHVCSETGLHEHCISDLFKSPDIAWRIAGLPDPGEEAKTYMDTAEIESEHKP